MAELMEMCVTNFPLSSTRPGIIAGFTYLLGRLQKAEVSGQVWINGSFVTEKIDPNDVDFVLCVFADLYDNSTGEQRAVLDAIADEDLKSKHKCDCYLSIEWPAGGPLHREGQENRKYWRDLFGHSRTGEEKGLAILALKGLV